MSDTSWRSLSADLEPGQAHHQGWYAVALSSDVPTDEPYGTQFLDERVVVYRDASGSPVVLGARCPHMGADLAVGDVVGDDLRCAYHHFRFGPDGSCTSIPCEGPIPRAARVSSRPALERFGLIWAWHGDADPLFAPPEFPRFAEEDLVMRARRTHVFEVAPWLSIGNTFDLMHLRHVHDLDFDLEPEDIRYLDEHHIELEIPFRSQDMGAFEQRIRVTGTNVVAFLTVSEETTAGLFTSTPIGDRAQTFYTSGVPREAARDDADLARLLDEQEAFGDGLLADDYRTLQGLRFQAGTLVEGDRALVDYMQWVDAFPRAVPVAAP